MNATVETTCTTCDVSALHDVTRVVVALPDKRDTNTLPCVLLGCPACGSAQLTHVPWRMATYLIFAGASALNSPHESALRPAYPDTLPYSATTPMTLDDLIDLHADLAVARVL